MQKGEDQLPQVGNLPDIPTDNGSEFVSRSLCPHRLTHACLYVCGLVLVQKQDSASKRVVATSQTFSLC